MKKTLFLFWLLFIHIQWVSAYTPSLEFQSKLETTTSTLDSMLEKKWDVYRTRFLTLLEIYKKTYDWNEKASYVLDYISINLIKMKQDNCVVYDDFSDSEKNNWIIINDWVMGGLSKWDIRFENKTLIFFGNINTNGGWFTSIRSVLSDKILSKVDYVKLRIKTDSRSYKLTFRDNYRNWVSYQADIPSQNIWIYEDISIPLSKLTANYFWRSIKTGAFQKNQAREIGFIISDGINGTFEIEIESIEFCSE